jgi:predicted Zn-dependent protease
LTTKKAEPAMPILRALAQDVPMAGFHLMVETVTLAVQRLAPADADAIAAGMRPFEPHYPGAKMARAVAAAAAGREGEAITVLEDLLGADPNAGELGCACALLKKERGDAGWSALAERVALNESADPDTRRAARELPGWPEPRPARPLSKLVDAGPRALRFSAPLSAAPARSTR